MAVFLYKWLFISLLPIGMLFHQKPNHPLTVTEFNGVIHPFYVSVVEINHNSKDKALEISCKIFVDDMEDVLKQNYKAAVDLTNEKQKMQNDKLINDYITRHLLVTADGKQMKYNYIGFEKEGESVYCYFEILNVSTIKKIDLTNSILQDFTDKQINIMHVTVGSNRKSYKLDYPQQQASFIF